MAIRVTPARGMNGLSQKNFENATKYTIEETSIGLVLHLYEGTRRISTYNAGCWESADLYTPVDTKLKAEKGKNKNKDRDKNKKPTKVDVPSGKRIAKRKTVGTTKSGANIRTSPLRGSAGAGY